MADRVAAARANLASLKADGRNPLADAQEIVRAKLKVVWLERQARGEV